MNPDYEIHTIRFGDAEWLKQCAPTLDDYAARHAVKLRIWDKPDINPAYPSAKFCQVDMLKEFLAGKAKWLVYVDADIWVHPAAPLPVLGPGFHIMNDRPGIWSRHWPDWCFEHFGIKPGNWTYKNAGVWMCDRDAAAKLLAVVKEPYLAACQEQHHWNWWLLQATKKPQRLKVRDLDSIWNRWPKTKDHGWFHHAIGSQKERKLELIFAKTMIEPIGEPPLLLESPQLDRAVVWPWRHDSDPEDILHSIASVLASFDDKECPLVILGTKKPEWWPEDHPRMQFVEAPGYAEALCRGLHVAKKVLWMNDDIALVGKCSWETFAVPRHRNPHVSEKLAASFLRFRRGWVRSRGQVFGALHKLRRDTCDYSTHTPYLFEHDKAVKTLKRFGVWNKMPFECAYFNEHHKPGRPVEGWLSTLPGIHSGQVVCNWSGQARTPEMMEWVAKTFPPVFASPTPV